ncbi:MAG: DUF4258 domain-containing protein [Spirochaetes bacterium]|jgi:hypothetical protein|nr:DUF4258 domain-containing protein [Spirochaetota bacterium]
MKNNLSDSSLRFSNHAEARKEQRAISDEAIQFVIDHGFIYYAGHCDTVYWFCRKALGYEGPGSVRFENIAVIVTYDGVVRTVMHCRRQPRHWKRAA